MLFSRRDPRGPGSFRILSPAPYAWDEYVPREFRRKSARIGQTAPLAHLVSGSRRVQKASVSLKISKAIPCARVTNKQDRSISEKTKKQ